MPNYMHMRRVATRHANEKAARHQPVPPAAPIIPAWDELRRLPDEPLRALADQLGIAWRGRSKTLSAIHKARSL